MPEHEPQPRWQQPEAMAADAEQPATPEASGDVVPRIWVGSLLDYNDGRLSGAWLDATSGEEALRESIASILASSPTAQATGEVAEEWGIFDSEGFGHYRVDAYGDLAEVVAVARGITAHGRAFAAWADLVGSGVELTDTAFQESFLGHYPSLRAWGEQVMDDLGLPQRVEELLPGDIARYVQVDGGAWARDALFSGDIAVVQNPDGGCWVFSLH